MYELEELRVKIQQQDYVAALQIIDELEEMSREDKINKIYSYAVILLLHLIKQAAENRTTSSWNRSIMNSTDNINRINKRRKSGGYYAAGDTLRTIFDEAYPRAVKEAAYEAFEGKLSWQELAEKVESDSIKNKAMAMLEYD